MNFFVNREAAEKTAHDVELRGGVPHLLQADLKEPAEIKRLVAEIKNRAGRLDVVVSNAASGVLRDGLELSPKQWDWVMATNARALLILAQEASRIMTPGGRIIALSSLGSQRVIPAMRRSACRRPRSRGSRATSPSSSARKGITVNTVSAGAVETDVWQAMPDGTAALAAIRERTPGGALVTADEVAGVVYFSREPGGAGDPGAGPDGGRWVLAPRLTRARAGGSS